MCVCYCIYTFCSKSLKQNFPCYQEAIHNKQNVHVLQNQQNIFKINQTYLAYGESTQCKLYKLSISFHKQNKSEQSIIQKELPNIPNSESVNDFKTILTVHNFTEKNMTVSLTFLITQKSTILMA